MVGCNLTLQDGTIVEAVYFNSDGYVYAHEPIADLYGSMGDLLAEHPEVQEVKIIGPVVPITTLKYQLEKDYARSSAMLNDQMTTNRQQYREAKENLKHLEALGGSVTFIHQPDDLTEAANDLATISQPDQTEAA